LFDAVEDKDGHAILAALQEVLADIPIDVKPQASNPISRQSSALYHPNSSGPAGTVG
jgi:hypothetical protein